MTWTLDPEPADAGMPLGVQLPFAHALYGLGSVFYAADEDTPATPITKISVRRHLRRHLLKLFRASSPHEVLPAFESAFHNWSLNAQWLFITNPSSVDLADLEALTRTLYQDWLLPSPWPVSLLLVVQSGVDGDAAICHCKDTQIDAQFRATLRVAASESGTRFTDDTTSK